MKNLTITIFLLFGLTQIGLSQQAFLRVSVADKVELRDSMIINLWRHYVYPSSRFEREEYCFHPKVNNPLEFSIPNPKYSMRLTLESNKTGFSLPFVLVESGDSVSMIVNKVKEHGFDLTVSGPGSAKYRFLLDLAQRKQHADGLWQYRERYKGSQELERDVDDLFLQWSFSLERYRQELSDTAYHILWADVVGYLNNYRLILVANAYARSDGMLKDDYEQTLVKLISSDRVFTYSPNLLALSKEYVSYLYNKEKIGLIYKHNKHFNKYELVLNAPYSFQVLYQTLRDGYEGHLRDKLLTYLFLNSSDVIKFFKGVNSEEFTRCMYDAMKVTEDLEMLRLIAREYEAVSGGQQAYNFSLPNSEGEAVRLSDFKGKVVLLDFWGSGCGGCLSFKQRFEREVYPHLKDNPDFVFVSINADKKKETWLKALPVYSNPTFVNLGLYEFGEGHSLVKHYNIKAWPFVVLVGRDGEIISTTVPLGSEDLLRLIQKQFGNSDI